MSNKVLLKKSSITAKVPLTSDLDYGEVALNYADGKLYFKNSSNTIQPLGISYTKVIANTTAQINQGYIANTGAGSFTITLPANPQTGNYVIIVDDGNFNTNPLYVGRGGQPIVGTAQDLTLDIQGVSVTLMYDGGQWNVYTQVGASGGSGSGTEGSEYNYNSFPSAIIPDTNNTYALGNATYGWSKLWFGDGTGQTTAAIADGSSITNSGGTITAQAGGLAGTTLKSTVVSSSLTSVGTITSGVWQGTAIANNKLANSSVTIGTTAISLGASSTTLAGLTSVTSTGFTGALTGNASTATTLQTARNINGVSFNGSADITVTAAAGTLTGTTLNSTITASSLTSVGTLTNATIAGAATVVSNSATDKYLNIGTHGQLYDDGNFHIHTSSGSLWLNSLDGGDINLGMQSTTGSSKAVAKNLSLDAGYGSTAPIYGVRAWISTGYNGTSVTTRGSGNLSMTRSGVGVYNFTFTTAMPDGNYCIQATAQTPGTNSDCAVNITNGVTPSTTGFSLTVARYGNGNEDTPILHVQVVR